MSDSNTSGGGDATPDALVEAYLSGVRYGIAYGATVAMTPDEKAKIWYHEAMVQARRAEYTGWVRDRTPARFWPEVMPGGWPLPPPQPSDDPADWWPEDGGSPIAAGRDDDGNPIVVTLTWPVPPPGMRGDAL